MCAKRVKGVLPTSEDKLSEAEASLDDTQKAFVETLDYSVQPIGLSFRIRQQDQ